MEEEFDDGFVRAINVNSKTAIIKKSQKANLEGLPIKKLSEIVNHLENDGYEIFNYLGKPNN